jgi:hypothetical protein
MSRKKRKAAKRRVIRKARAKQAAPRKEVSLIPYDSKCNECGKIRKNEFGWRTTIRSDGPIHVCCPECKPPQEESFTWDDWDED